MTYLSRETAPKEKTGGSDIAKGSILLEHLSAQLFLELRKVATHTHQGGDSVTLRSGATPEMVRGYTNRNRIENYTTTWSGGASGSGSLAVTFAKEFKNAPTVVVVPTGRSDANIRVNTSAPSTTGVTIYWALTTGTATEVKFDLIAIGR